MLGGVNRGLPIARLLMVISSFAPLFVLWAIRGARPIPDSYWILACLVFALLPSLALIWRWRIALRNNDHRVIIVAAARDQSDHLLVYLFAMLLPLYTVNLEHGRELFAVAAAFTFIVFLFWHMNLHYMNVAFGMLGYRVYTVEIGRPDGEPGSSIVLLSKKAKPPPIGASVNGLRISDTVFVEKVSADAE
jgi:hypothetical protein